MFKGGIFCIGLATGLYLGVQLREQGYSTGLTKAYYAYKNHGGMAPKTPDQKITFDEVYDYYRQGLLNDESKEKFESILKNRNYDKLDEVVMTQLNSVINDPQIKRVMRSNDNKLYEK